MSQKFRNIDKILEDSRSAMAHGGQLIIDALAKEFGLWKRLAACELIDPRRDKSRGFSPEAIVAQLVFNGGQLRRAAQLFVADALGGGLCVRCPIGAWQPRGQ